jgi:hypothetical protein
LRDAVVASNEVAEPNVINLKAGDYKLTIAGANEDASATGDLDVGNSVTIKGAGAGSTKIDGNHLDRVFEVTDGASFTLSGVTVTNGAAVPTSSVATALGGAIYDSGGGPLTITNAMLVDNHALNTDGQAGEGGAIASGQPLSITNTTLSGNEADGDAGDGGAIDMLASTSATLDHVTATNNHAGLNSGFGFGGVVNGSSTVTASSSTFTGNTAGGGLGGFGGAIYAGSMTATGSSFRSNHAGGNGGSGFGGALDLQGAASITGSAFSGNTAGGAGTAGSSASANGSGGAVYAADPVALTASTVTGNVAGGGSTSSDGFGGGIDSTVTATASTIADNTAGGGGAPGYGGGVDSTSGASVFTNSTITGNRAGGGGSSSSSFGGGINGQTTLVYSDVVGNGTGSPSYGGGLDGSVTSRGSIVANNSADNGVNCSAAATDQGHNLENGTSCGFTGTGDLNSPVSFAPLANNGGPTPTLRLLAGSPAINHGETSGCPTTDQRGVARPVGPACDIGSYEVSAPPSVVTGASKIGRKHHVTLSGSTSNHDLVPGSASFLFGKTTSYGHSSAAVSVPAGASGSAVKLSVGGLAAGTLYHYRLVMRTPDGTGLGADKTFRTPAAPKLSGVRVKRSKSGGFSVSYTDSEAGTVTFTVLSHKGKKVRSFTHSGKAGHHKLSFSGKVRGKPLAPGSYKLRAVARNAFGAAGRPVVKGFKVK